MAKRDSAIQLVKKRIVPVAKADPYLKLLLYGRHGKGKTRIAGTAPKALIVDVNEKGTKSIRRTDAEVFPVRRWEDITYVYWYLRSGEHEYETVVIDTITGMQDLCMKFVLGEAEDRDPNRPLAMPEQRSWNRTSELMKRELLNYRNLPMNVIFIALERIITNDEDESQERVPYLSPAIRGTACASVDIIARVYQREVRVGKKGGKKEEKRWETRMLVGPHDEFESKDRTGSLPRIVRNPNVAEIIETMNEEEE